MAKTIAPPNITGLRGGWGSASFLATISGATVEACLSAGQCYEYGAREMLIREGSRERNVFLLLTGCVKVTAKLAKKGEVALLGVRFGGDVVGELAALDGQERAANVQVCGRLPTVCCVLTSEAFHRVLGEDSDALMTLSATVGAKLRSSTRRRIDYAGHPPFVRMARVLVELAEDHGQRSGSKTITIGVNLGQVELGTLIGVGEATAQRALRRLRELDLVVTSNRRPEIRDLDRLRAVAGLNGSGHG
jgi:CRP/FNR family transcriptional regulator, cyclic AMP receptor protein